MPQPPLSKLSGDDMVSVYSRGQQRDAPASLFVGQTAPAVAITGGTIAGATVSGGTVAGAAITAGTIDGAAITAGTIDGSTIGATTPVQGQVYRPINAQALTTYTLVLADSGKLVSLTNSGAITLTVPTNASVAFPVGAEIELVQLGAGQVTVTASGPTLNSYLGKSAIAGQFAKAMLKQTAADVWLLSGTLA